MPGRTMSNSSDVSLASTGSRSDDNCDLVMSGLNTPTQQNTGFDGFKVQVPMPPELRSPGGKFDPFVSYTFFPHCNSFMCGPILLMGAN
ncbi:hypothetical protein CMUS01_04091 [Colletotrichum musicola]|uniref:Uncharacterized protein n=1 Tax=Colletotrichum musicola TaxID=2175873 RepID=A0A8H6NP59_9PEZI|nr:hypothetical protein CMUS01_04091 [Colletotrichum musicola]